MAISDLKGIIDAKIKTNGRQEITGASLNEVLTQMVDATDAELAELSQETELLKEQLEENEILIEDLQNTKIDRENDDYYPKMAVGLADNLAGVDVVDSEVNFRRSGGGAISDGVARIEAIKGNSVVWNQLRDVAIVSLTTIKANITLEVTKGSNIIKLSGIYDGTTGDLNYYIPAQFSNIVGVIGHRYLCIIRGNTNSTMTVYGGVSPSVSNIESCAIVTCSKEGYINLMPKIKDGIAEGTEINEEISLYCTDLTQMFGAGNEPTTIDDFYARIPMGVDLNTYNEGEVIHMDVQSIESQGVNAWDEEWENGSFNLTNGVNIQTEAEIRNKNYIKVLPKQGYYFKMPTNYRFAFYDEQKNYISGDGKSTNQVITTPGNCHYLRFAVGSSVNPITTYNHDICINISDTSINGKYFPYIKRVEDLSIIRKYFPQGMKSAGTAHDEIRYNKESGKWEKVVRIGEVDLGTLTFRSYRSVFISSVISGMNSKLNTKVGLLARYPYCSANNGYTMLDNAEDKVYCTNGGSVGGNGNLAISDSSYTDVASFKAAMSGVILYYELAEPIVTELDAEDQFRDLDYQVWNCGTEKAIAEGKSAPLAADITYGFNAIGKIKELESLVAALRAKVGI